MIKLAFTLIVVAVGVLLLIPKPSQHPGRQPDCKPLVAAMRQIQQSKEGRTVLTAVPCYTPHGHIDGGGDPY